MDDSETRGRESAPVVNPLLPDPVGLRCCQLRIDSDGVIIVARTMAPAANCPTCGQPSSRVHSRYTRKLADLPWNGRPVRLLLEVRKLFCDAAACPRRIFTECMPSVAAAYARQTSRLAQALVGGAFACGGEGGARLAARLGMPTSPDTLLRRIRQTPLVHLGVPRVLGVDDWAVRQGQRYGTILCDLERRRPVDLLPERSADALSAWLRTRPGIEVISRDRGGYYAQGAAAGAPDAQQVADRWHLLHNLRDALVRLLDRCHADLRTAARAMAAFQAPRAPPTSQASGSSTTSVLTRSQQLSQARRARRVQRYEQVLALSREGLSQRAIAKRIGLHRETVARFIHAGAFPERTTRSYPTRVDAHADYLRQRWEAGCRNAAQLARELTRRGFNGSYHAVRRYLARWRYGERQGPSPSSPAATAVAQTPSAKRVARWLLVEKENLAPEQRAFVEALIHCRGDLKHASRLAQAFARLVRQRRPDGLGNWMAHAIQPRVPRELRIFANGLRSDHDAVRAALALPWSNGPVEGQVNRLKLIKRQMYGRAKFDLLRQRVLYRG